MMTDDNILYPLSYDIPDTVLGTQLLDLTKSSHNKPIIIPTTELTSLRS